MIDVPLQTKLKPLLLKRKTHSYLEKVVPLRKTGRKE